MIGISEIFRLMVAGISVWMIILLLSFMVNFECSSGGYPVGVIAAMFVALGMLFIYTKLDVARRGLFKAKVNVVRSMIVIAAVAAAALVMALSVTGNWCSGFLSEVIVPFIVLLFYCGVILSCLFSDAYLGVFRSVVRVGVTPHNFFDEERSGGLRRRR